jgi:hypothetical protein
MRKLLLLSTSLICIAGYQTNAQAQNVGLNASGGSFSNLISNSNTTVTQNNSSSNPFTDNNGNYVPLSEVGNNSGNNSNMTQSLQNMQSGIQNLANNISNAVQNTGNNQNTGMTQSLQNMQSSIQNLANNVSNAISNSSNGQSGLTQQEYNNMMSTLSSLSQQAQNAGNGQSPSMQQSMLNMQASIQNIANAAGQAAQNSTNSQINTSAGQQLVNSIGQMVGNSVNAGNNQNGIAQEGRTIRPRLERPTENTLGGYTQEEMVEGLQNLFAAQQGQNSGGFEMDTSAAQQLLGNISQSMQNAGLGQGTRGQMTQGQMIAGLENMFATQQGQSSGGFQMNTSAGQQLLNSLSQSMQNAGVGQETPGRSLRPRLERPTEGSMGGYTQEEMIEGLQNLFAAQQGQSSGGFEMDTSAAQQLLGNISQSMQNAGLGQGTRGQMSQEEMIAGMQNLFAAQQGQSSGGFEMDTSAAQQLLGNISQSMQNAGLGQDTQSGGFTQEELIAGIQNMFGSQQQGQEGSFEASTEAGRELVNNIAQMVEGNTGSNGNPQVTYTREELTNMLELMSSLQQETQNTGGQQNPATQERMQELQTEIQRMVDQRNNNVSNNSNNNTNNNAPSAFMGSTNASLLNMNDNSTSANMNDNSAPNTSYNSNNPSGNTFGGYTNTGNGSSFDMSDNSTSFNMNDNSGAPMAISTGLMGNSSLHNPANTLNSWAIPPWNAPYESTETQPAAGLSQFDATSWISQMPNGQGYSTTLGFQAPYSGGHGPLVSSSYSNVQIQFNPLGIGGLPTPGGTTVASLFDGLGNNPAVQAIADSLNPAQSLALIQTAALVQAGILPLHFLITWGAGSSDLDLHLTGPMGANRFHIYFGARGSLTAEPNAALIDDCISASCAEVIRIEDFNPGGVYRASVYNYGNGSGTNLASDSGVEMMVIRGGEYQTVTGANGDTGTIVTGGDILFQGSPTPGQSGNTWRAIEVNPDTGEVIFVNQMGDTAGGSGNVQ